MEAYSKDAISPTAANAVITKLRLIVIAIPEEFEKMIVLNNCRGDKERSPLVADLGMVLLDN